MMEPLFGTCYHLWVEIGSVFWLCRYHIASSRMKNSMHQKSNYENATAILPGNASSFVTCQQLHKHQINIMNNQLRQLGH